LIIKNKLGGYMERKRYKMSEKNYAYSNRVRCNIPISSFFLVNTHFNLPHYNISLSIPQTKGGVNF